MRKQEGSLSTEYYSIFPLHCSWEMRPAISLRKCPVTQQFSPMNDTTVRSFMYEQVSRDCFIRFICCLAVSLKFNSLAVFVVAVDGVGFNFNRYFSSSVYVVVDTKLFDPILPMCDKSFCLYQRISVPIVNYIYYGNYFFSICWIIL